MGRRRQFDEELVLTQIMEHFWKHGFSATKVEHLAALTGLTKTSLYHAFGNKEAMFIKIVDRYAEQELSNMIDLDSSALLSSNLSNLFEQEFSQDRNPLFSYGCLVTNSIPELNANEPELHEYVSGKLAGLREIFFNFVSLYTADGRIKGMSAEELTDFYMVFRLGFKIQSRNLLPSPAIDSAIDGFVKTVTMLENQE